MEKIQPLDVHICPGRRAINLSTIFRAILGHRIGGYGLRRMCSHCLRASCDFFYGASGQPGVNPYRDCAEKLYGNRAMSVQLPCSLRNLRTEIVRSPCGDRPSHGARAGIVQCHLYDMSTGYGLTIFSNW